MTLEGGGIKAVFAAHVSLEFRQIAELSLTRRVIHHRDDANAILWAEFGQLFGQCFRTDLGPQVDVVADPQGSGGAHRQNGIDHAARISLVLVLGRDHRPDADRIEHGGDAGARQFTVMGEDGRAVRPVDLGARRHMPFQIIGVQFDQTGSDVVALHVLRAFGHGGAEIDVGDYPVCDAERSGLDAIPQDQAGVGENCLLGHGIIF